MKSSRSRCAFYAARATGCAASRFSIRLRLLRDSGSLRSVEGRRDSGHRRTEHDRPARGNARVSADLTQFTKRPTSGARPLDGDESAFEISVPAIEIVRPRPEAAVVQLARWGTRPARLDRNATVSPGSVGSTCPWTGDGSGTEVDVEVTLQNIPGGTGRTPHGLAKTLAPWSDSTSVGRWAVHVGAVDMQFDNIQAFARDAIAGRVGAFFLGTIGWRDGARENDWPVEIWRERALCSITEPSCLASQVRDASRKSSMEIRRSGRRPDGGAHPGLRLSGGLLAGPATAWNNGGKARRPACSRCCPTAAMQRGHPASTIWIRW